ncbi:hypothetical protein ACFL6G_07605 [candidate division KSB1 bacterium]
MKRPTFILLFFILLSPSLYAQPGRNINFYVNAGKSDIITEKLSKILVDGFSSGFGVELFIHPRNTITLDLMYSRYEYDEAGFRRLNLFD